MEYFEHDRRVNMKTYPLYTLVFKNSSSEFESAIMRNFIEHNFPVETINFEANAVKSFCERSTAMSIRRDFVWFYSEEFLHSFIDLSNCKTIDDSIHIIAIEEIDDIDLVFEILERFFNHNIYLIVQVERIFWRVYSRMPEELMRDVGNLDSVSLLQNFWWNGIECYYESLHETFFQSDLIVSSIHSPPYMVYDEIEKRFVRGIEYSLFTTLATIIKMNVKFVFKNISEYAKFYTDDETVYSDLLAGWVKFMWNFP